MMKLNENDETKAYTLLSKPYFEETYLGKYDSKEEYRFKELLRKYKSHLVEMVKLKSKFEVEALSC